MKDIIIIGGGPAGLTAALYAGRAGLKVTVIESMFSGGQAATTFEVENYPGLLSVSGLELAQKLDEQARHFGAEILNEDVIRLETAESGVPYGLHKVYTTSGVYETRAVIVATGARPRKLSIPGEDIFAGRGVSYCATCDGAFFRNKPVAVIGGGNTALEDAIYLAALCSKVYLIHRRAEFRGDTSLVKRLVAFPSISLLLEHVPSEITGSDTVESIFLRYTGEGDGGTSKIDVNGIFVAVGVEPNSGMFRDILKLKDGYIVTGRDMDTNVPGIFAAGDVRDTPLRQIVTACSDGAIAASKAVSYLQK